MNTQTQMNTQTTYTVEQVAMMLLNLSGRVDNIEAQLSKKSLNKTTKPKRSAEEIEAEKLRKAAAAEAVKVAKLKKAEEKRLAKEAKAEKKRLAKEAKKLVDEKLKAEKKLADEKLKAEKLEAKKAKKLADEKLKAEKKLAKGPSLDKSYTKKRFNLYRDLKTNDPDNQFKGTKGAFLRIAKKKDGSDTTVYRVSPDSWTEEAIEHFNSLEDKWDRKTLPFSPNYVAPEPKIKSTKKKASKKKNSIKKTLVEQTVVIDTDDEMEEEPPADYAVHRCMRLGPKSSEITWVRFDSTSSLNTILKQNGYVPIDKWAWMRFQGDVPFNNKEYETNPLKPKVGKNIVKDGKVIGNCCESFNPVTEEGKDAEIVQQEADDELEDIEDDDELLIPDTFDYDSDGYRPFRDGMKITRDNRVFMSDEECKFLGKYNEDADKIESDSSEDSSEEDAFGSDNDMGDTAVF